MIANKIEDEGLTAYFSLQVCCLFLFTVVINVDPRKRNNGLAIVIMGK